MTDLDLFLEVPISARHHKNKGSQQQEISEMKSAVK